MKKRKPTKKEFEKLEKNLVDYLGLNTNFTVECYGAQLVAIIMALKMFSQLDEIPKIIADDFQALVDYYAQETIKKFPGVELLDFDDPARYFMSLLNAEEEVKMGMAVVKLDNIFEIIQQQFGEEN